MFTLKYAIIGCGRIAVKHLEAANKSGYQLVALCDISLDALRSFVIMNNVNGERVSIFTTVDAMIETLNLDVAAITTPSGTHYEIAKKCINKGIHVIIEKPITLSLKEADELVKLCEQKNMIATVCHQNRFNRSVREVKNAIDGGKIKKILYACAHVRWCRDNDYYNKGAWRGTWDYDGGVLMNQGIHNADIIRWLCGGNVKEVFAYIDRLNHDNIETEDIALAVIQFGNGSYGTIEVTTDVFPENLEETLYLFGDEATIKLGGKSVNTIEIWKVKFDERDINSIKSEFSEYPNNIYGNGHIPLYDDFYIAVNKKRRPYISLRDARDSLELVLAIYKSALTHMPIELPLMNDFSLADMKGWKPKNENERFEETICDFKIRDR